MHSVKEVRFVASLVLSSPGAARRARLALLGRLVLRQVAGCQAARTFRCYALLGISAEVGSCVLPIEGVGYSSSGYVSWSDQAPGGESEAGSEDRTLAGPEVLRAIHSQFDWAPGLFS